MRDDAQDRYRVHELPDLVYATHDGEVLHADAYVPDGPGPFPGFVLLHGGAFTKGSRTSYASWGRWLAAAGYVALSADYRLARPDRPTFPHAIWDTKAAIQFLRGHRALNADPDRIGVMGGSAGGYLAAMAALTSTEPEFDNPYPDPYAQLSAEVTVVVPMAGTFDMIERWAFDRIHRPPDEQVAEIFLGGTPLDLRKAYYEASALYHASAANARGSKWLIAWGTHDEITPPETHSEALARHLSLAGALVRLVPIVGAPHFWYIDADVADPSSFSGHLGRRLLDFLEHWARW